MRKIGFKALNALLAASRRSKKQVDPTLAVAILSTIVMLSLLALYLWQKIAEFP